MEKLELKHIAPYLPYGLKVDIGEYVVREILGYKLDSNGEVKFYCNDSTDRGVRGYYHIQYCRPILRPLSSPYKPLFGHTTGRQSKTIWMAFMKHDNPELLTKQD